MKIIAKFQPIVSAEQFFYDDPDAPYQSLPSHSLEESPSAPIIGSKAEGKFVWHYCKLHPDDVNSNLSSIEHHCKYKDPEIHKQEILRILQQQQPITSFQEEPNSKSRSSGSRGAGEAEHE